MDTKDQYLKIFLDGTIHLSKKDYSFFYNLSNMMKQKSSVTTNQSKLYDKLVHKYKRQLQKNGFDADKITNLEWKVILISTSDQYLNSYVTIKDDQIEIKAPFKQEFIRNITKQAINDIENPNIQYINTYQWNKLSRVYVSNFSTVALKIAVTYCSKHFENVILCDRTKEILEFVGFYKNAKIWDPTYTKIGDNYYVVACNHILYSKIQDYNFSTDPKFLYYLSSLGIKTDESILKDNDILRCAANYISTVSLDEIDTVINTMKQVGVNKVIFSRDLIYQKNLLEEIKTRLTSSKIDALPYNMTHQVRADSFYFTFNSSILNTSQFSKIIVIKNHRPVYIK